MSKNNSREHSVPRFVADGSVSQGTLLLRPLPPFRLDLTAWALRRRPQNLIDRWDGATYRRVIVVNQQPVEISVAKAAKHGNELRVSIERERPDDSTKKAIARSVENALGMSVDLRGFYRAAGHDPKLARLVYRFRGMKPPRFFSVFEGLINGIACQQLSLSLGIQLLNRLAKNFGLSVGQGNSVNHAFPRPQDLAGLKPGAVRKLGFNFQKARAMIEISRAIVEGRLDIEGLQSVNDREVLQQLMELRGVGRWTAELTMLRGMGRWHIFPVDDLGARNGLARWLRLRKPLDAAHAQHLLARWKPYGGLIYFHMLMNGLDEAGCLSTTRDKRGLQPSSICVVAHI